MTALQQSPWSMHSLTASGSLYGVQLYDSWVVVLGPLKYLRIGTLRNHKGKLKRFPSARFQDLRFKGVRS